MQVEAIYENGRVELLLPLKLKRNGVRLIVLVPSEEVTAEQSDDSAAPASYQLSPRAAAAAQELRQRMNAIRNAPLPPDEELPELTEKQLERIEAAALRDEIKGMRP